MNTKEQQEVQSKSDIMREALVMRIVPAALRPYLLLGRFDRPIGIWLLLLPGWWSILLASSGADFHMAYMLVLFGIGAVAMRSAGCVINDIWDRDLDRKVERTRGRPLAAEDLSLKQAFGFLVLLLLIGLFVLVQMNAMTIILGFVSIPLIIAYPLMKRFTWWPQAFLGLTFNFGVLMGWSAVAGDLSLSALLIYIGAIFWTLGYDTIYAHQDKEDDMMAGIKSTALRFGRASKLWVIGFYIFAFKLMALGFAALNPLYALALLPVGAHLAWQVMRWEHEDPQSALVVFKANRDAGLLILAASALTLVV